MIHSLVLLFAGCAEVAGVSSLNGYNSAVGFRRKAVFLMATVIFFACSLSSLSFSMREIPLSVAYAIWTGIGTIGAVAVGVYFNGDKISLFKGASIFLIMFSVIMLKIES